MMIDLFLVEGNEGEDPANEKEKKLVNWTNSHLVKSKESKPVKNIGSNLRSGLKLIILLKVIIPATYTHSICIFFTLELPLFLAIYNCFRC